MKNKTMTWLLIGVIMVGLMGCDRFSPSGNRVERVSDGDTIKVNDGSATSFTVRFACIDAPEVPHSQKERNSRSSSDKNQFAWGEKAQARVEQLIKKSRDRVNLTITDSDRYGRKVAEIRLTDGTFIQQVLIREGLAKVYRPYLNKCPSRDLIQQSETQAQKSKLGVWNDPKFVNPWEWRALRK